MKENLRGNDRKILERIYCEIMKRKIQTLNETEGKGGNDFLERIVFRSLKALLTSLTNCGKRILRKSRLSFPVSSFSLPFSLSHSYSFLRKRGNNVFFFQIRV